MEILIYITSLILLYYALQIGLLIYGFSNIPKFIMPEEFVKQKFSIIIPFRDEEENLSILLDSFAKIDYDFENYELIFVNDQSSDQSVQIINNWRFQNPFFQLTILNNVLISNSPKKDAISRAITIAKFPWILTIDADCVLPNKLLNTYAAYITKNPEKEFIIGGVEILKKNGFLNIYQQFDIASLQAVTIGSFGIDEVFMCNGANLLFSKNIFKEVDGYKNVNHIASGDDVFLLQKVKNLNANRIDYVFNRDAIVKTKSLDSFYEIIKQRSRWGKKSIAYNNLYPKILGVTTILANLLFITLLISCIFDTTYFKQILGVLVFKITIDTVLLFQYHRYNKIRFGYFLFNSIVYPFVIFGVILHTLSFSIHWKGRKII